MLNFVLAAALAASLASFSAPQFVQPQPTETISEAGPTIRIELDLGRKSKGCTKVGICVIKIEIELNVRPNHGNGTATINENGGLAIIFESASMDKETVKNHFGSGFFVLEEDYIVDGDVAEKLGIDSYTIKAGKYAAKQTKEGFNVNF